MIRKVIAIAMASQLFAASAQAAPGVGEKIYGAEIEPGITELEARYGRLTGGPDDGEDGLVLEVAHSFSKQFYAALLGEFARDPGGNRKLEAIAVEGIVHLGKVEALGIDTAAYVEYAAAIDGPHAVEIKGLIQHKQGPFDARLNLVAEREFRDGAPVAFEYAASADWKALGDFRLGAAAFGQLGDSKNFLSRGEHYAGPVTKFEVEPFGEGKSEFEIEAGYLFAIGDAARSRTKGQMRLLIEWETKF